MLSVIYFVSSIFLASAVTAMNSTREIEGYPTGLISDCAGSTKPAIISKKSLKRLTFTVQGPGPAIMARRVRYNYHQMNLLIKDPDFDFKKKTILYAGGYMDSTALPPAWIMGKHYKDVGYNVLLLDTNYFTTTYYPRAARFMRAVGKHVAEMLVELTKLGLDPKKLELIGISLGGQTISFTAKSYQQLTGVKISRVTGLDPSGPCFRHLGPEDRLDQSDADFVEMVATNIDGYGMAAPVGHSNFYINGGEYQSSPLLVLPCTDFCSHIRALGIWQAALYFPDSFIAIQCDTIQQARTRSCYDRLPRVTNLFGPKTNKTIQGIFFLSTSNDYPYYLGEKGLNGNDDFYERVMGSFNADNVIKI